MFLKIMGFTIQKKGEVKNYPVVEESVFLRLSESSQFFPIFDPPQKKQVKSYKRKHVNT